MIITGKVRYLEFLATVRLNYYLFRKPVKPCYGIGVVKSFANMYRIVLRRTEMIKWMHVIVLKGTEIEESCIVGAGTVCTKKYMLPHAVIAGNPGKIVRENVDWKMPRI